MRWDKSARTMTVAAVLLLPCACAEAPPPPAEPPLVADPAVGAEGTRPPPTELELGVALMKEEHYAEARPHFEKAVEQTPKSAEANYFLALSRSKTGDRAGAETGFKTALELDNDFIKAAENLAALYLEDPARPDEAIAILEKRIPKGKENASMLADLGRAYGMKGDIATAGKHYEAAIAKGDSVVLRIAYGTLLADHHEQDRALAQLRRALEIAPEDGELLATLARKLAAVGDNAACVKALDRALAQRPREADWLVRRGGCRHEVKDDAGARSDYEAAVAADPTFAQGHYQLGVAMLADKKQRAAGIAELELAAKLGASTPTGKAANEKLATLRPAGKPAH